VWSGEEWGTLSSNLAWYQKSPIGLTVLYVGDLHSGAVVIGSEGLCLRKGPPSVFVSTF
jgi:hypothetical protein